MAKILMVGCGEMGSEFARCLANQGHQVTGLKRSPPVIDDKLINYYAADIRIPSELENLDGDFEQIFFILSADGRTEASYREIYESGLNNLLAKFNRTAVKPSWWMVSSTSVYGQTGGEQVDEESPAIPEVVTARLIRAAEQKLIDLDKRNIVVRFSGIYGPGRDYLLKLAGQIPAIQKDPAYFTNRIHAKDCVAVLDFLLAQRLAGVALEQCYLASDDDPAAQWEVMSWLAERMGLAPPRIKVVTGFVDSNKRCCNLRLKKLGYEFIYPTYKHGYSELL